MAGIIPHAGETYVHNTNGKFYVVFFSENGVVKYAPAFNRVGEGKGLEFTTTWDAFLLAYSRVIGVIEDGEGGGGEEGGGGTTLDHAMSVPTLTLDTGSLVYPPEFTIGNLSDAAVADILELDQRTKAGAVIATFTNTIDLAEATAEAAAFTGLSSIASGTNRFFTRRIRGSFHSAWSSPAVLHGPDDQEAILTSPTSADTGSTTGTIGVTTDTAEGTLYYVVNTSATLLGVATVKAGSSQAVTVSGAQSINITGLTASTGYYGHLVHTDVALNDSAESVTPLFTTDATPAMALDSANKAAGLTISGASGKTGTGTGGGGKQKVRSNLVLPTGKGYFEVRYDTHAADIAVGLVKASYTDYANTLDPYNLGDQTIAMIVEPGYADVRGPSGFLIPITGDVGGGGAGIIIQIAYDTAAGKMWPGINNAYSGNPSAGTGGYTIPTGAIHALVIINSSGAFTFRPTLAEQTHSPPSGFTAIA